MVKCPLEHFTEPPSTANLFTENILPKWGAKSVSGHRVSEREGRERDECVVGSIPSQPITHFFLNSLPKPH
ncbi:hypothetical protein HanRHA438_Chr01g0023231 [Helianthus annuus]|nr:hypothetical protein HanRHA438_Chr01g0023231 [Helianthus annuus]